MRSFGYALFYYIGGRKMIIIENEELCLKLDENCITQSLVCKATGEECLKCGEDIALFSLTEERPYNNEIKLGHPNKKTIFQAKRVRREENNLIVGFELVGFEAVIEIVEAPRYIYFKLKEFIVKPENFGVLAMDIPPVAEFRLMQLPVPERERFGEWLNVSWDDKVAVNVLATSPTARIDFEKRKEYRVLTADAINGIEREGCGAALIVCPSESLLDIIEQIEEDFDLPKGVKSRRSEHVNGSIFCAHEISPATVDREIAWAKKGGLNYMQINYGAIFKEEGGKKFFGTGLGWSLVGDYEIREDKFPNGIEDVKAMLAKIREAGIHPGLHTMHSHIGIGSKYISPVADHRLSIKRYFTLSRPLDTDDTTVYVEQNPIGSVMHERCKVLKFGGELIYYENYSTEKPYCFTGCKRGHYGTNVIPHELGKIGGILDISEFEATTVHIDQTTSLQDEMADEIAKVYNLGFEFMYFDGSEGTQAPYEYNVPNAQYKVYKKLNPEPLFSEGAAKSHFSWHMISGGNAFDSFADNVFKEKIVQFPFEEASRMADDFTSVNFGWFTYGYDTPPDNYEFGTSIAAAWDCPISTVRNVENVLSKNPRTDDNFEVLRRWEDVRRKKWLTKEQKEMLKNIKQEHTLLINESGEYELVPYDEIKEANARCQDIKAFSFTRANKNYIVFWHATGDGKVRLPLDISDVVVEEEIGGEKTVIEQDGTSIVSPLSHKRYLSSTLPMETLIEAFKNCEVETTHFCEELKQWLEYCEKMKKQKNSN